MFGVSLEYLMFGGIGFCLAWLTALMVLPAVHNRAMRLARERYDDLPLSIQEIRAEKDTIRAGFAAATRELELRVEKLREKTAAHATDVARKNQVVDRLKQEIDTVTAALRESETREQTARDELREAKRSFVDKDVTLGTAEVEITGLKRELAANDTARRAIEDELAALRGDLSAKQAALYAAEAEIASLNARLRESAAGEADARNQLRESRRGVADKDTALETVESEIAKLRRELAARDAALQTGERDLAATRTELAGKDAALNRAETEIAAIKAEIAALTKLLITAGSNSGTRGERPTPADRRVEIVPFVPASRTGVSSQQVAEPAEVASAPRHAGLQALRAQAEPQPVQKEPQPVQKDDMPPARAPIDLVAAPTRLIPPTIPQAPHQGTDSVGRALNEIADGGRRLDERQAGQNQRLRATYIPLVKSST
jgi:predicted  nucleic acid-binding Zn-ribbon protein